jgi:hypothetical protein
MNKLRQIRIPIYEQDVHIFFGDKNECIDALKNIEVSNEIINFCFQDSENTSGRWTQWRDDMFNLMWMPSIPTTTHDYGILVHEISHGVFFILDHIGMKHTLDSDEAFAYLQGYMFREIDNIIMDIKEEQDKQ